MATLLGQDYDPALGVPGPPSVRAVGRYRDFMAVIRETNRVYNLLCAKNPAAAAYVLTNAHRRRVLLKINAREMYHVARLRADAHAQWDIRRMSEKMLGLAAGSCRGHSRWLRKRRLCRAASKAFAGNNPGPRTESHDSKTKLPIVLLATTISRLRPLSWARPSTSPCR
jgi:thymidylate synthase ThyX